MTNVVEFPDKRTELHNKLAGEIVASIVKPVIDAGGTMPEVLVVLESVVVGTLLAVTKWDWKDDKQRQCIAAQAYLDSMAQAAAIRLRQIQA